MSTVNIQGGEITQHFSSLSTEHVFQVYAMIIILNKIIGYILPHVELCLCVCMYISLCVCKSV